MTPDAFLTELLAGGPLPAREVFGAAAEHGFIDRTLRRAADRLGVSRTGPAGSRMWALSADTDTVTDNHRGRPYSRTGPTAPVRPSSGRPGHPGITDDGRLMGWPSGFTAERVPGMRSPAEAMAWHWTGSEPGPERVRLAYLGRCVECESRIGSDGRLIPDPWPDDPRLYVALCDRCPDEAGAAAPLAVGSRMAAIFAAGPAA
jgi:hypothetical protein